MKKDALEEIGVIGGLILVQFVYAGNSVLLSCLMSGGLTPLTIVIFSTFATFLVVSPFAFYFERKKWPSKFSFKFATQLVLISFGGVTLFQSFFLKGIKLTSPALATTLGDFPAPMSLCAITSLIGVVITAVVQLVQGQTMSDIFFPLVDVVDLIGYSFLGGAVGGACVSFNGWAMKKRGPVLVSMFNPIGTVISVVLSVITLGETIDIGSLCGMFLMFTGLYFFLWAKGKEGYSDDPLESSEYNPQKPLLS
ncbi:WAT1-related protein At5g47470 [Linum perenne]